MKKIPAFLFAFFSAVFCFAQPGIDTEKITDSIVKEGKWLYRSEMASWYGTDIFMEKLKDRAGNARGYFSYPDGKLTNCIFFSKDETPKVLATISFDSTFQTATAKIDSKEREFTKYENEIYTIRKLALEVINGDTLFKVYENTSLNVIPYVENGLKKVYVLTGPRSAGEVIIGNDYLLTYDEQNKMAVKKRLHKNILRISYVMKDGQQSIGAVHSHLPETGEFITSTDICTLMLYEKFAKWEQHVVISKNYVSLWDCKKDQLVILSKEAWDKINGTGK